MCIWFNWKGIFFFYKLLLQDQTLNSDKFISNCLIKGSNWWKASTIGKMSFSIKTTPDLKSLCQPRRHWYTLAEMSYYAYCISDLTSSVYHLIWSLQNLNGKNLSSLETCKSYLDQSVIQKKQSSLRMESWVVSKMVKSSGTN